MFLVKGEFITKIGTTENDLEKNVPHARNHA